MDSTYQDTMPKGMDFEGLRIPPHSIEAESSLLAVLDLVRCMHYVCHLLYMVIKERLQILGLDSEFEKTSALISQLIDRLEAEQHAKNV